MTEKHDPETTPLPAPLPGLSMEVDAVLHTQVGHQAAYDPALASAAPAGMTETAVHGRTSAAPAPKEDADPQPHAELYPPRHRLWWIIGSLGLFALGVGAGALLWQPHPSTTAPSAPLLPPTPPPILPSPPVQVVPIAPAPVAPTVTPPTVTPPIAPPTAALPPAPPVATAPPIEASPPPSTVPGVLPTISATPTAPIAPPAPAAPTVHATPVALSSPPLHETPPSSKPEHLVRPIIKPKPLPPRPVVAAAPPIAAARPPVAVARPEPVALTPVKQLSQPIMRQVMLGAERGFKACVKEAWGTNISIGIVVESSGQIQKAEILGPLAQSGTGRCISDLIRKLHFPPFTEGGATKQFFWSYQIPNL